MQKGQSIRLCLTVGRSKQGKGTKHRLPERGNNKHVENTEEAIAAVSTASSETRVGEIAGQRLTNANRRQWWRRAHTTGQVDTGRNRPNGQLA